MQFWGEKQVFLPKNKAKKQKQTKQGGFGAK